MTYFRICHIIIINGLILFWLFRCVDLTAFTTGSKLRTEKRHLFSMMDPLMPTADHMSAMLLTRYWSCMFRSVQVFMMKNWIGIEVSYMYIVIQKLQGIKTNNVSFWQYVDKNMPHLPSIPAYSVSISKCYRNYQRLLLIINPFEPCYLVQSLGFSSCHFNISPSFSWTLCQQTT